MQSRFNHVAGEGDPKGCKELPEGLMALRPYTSKVWFWYLDHPGRVPSPCAPIKRTFAKLGHRFDGLIQTDTNTLGVTALF